METKAKSKAKVKKKENHARSTRFFRPMYSVCCKSVYVFVRLSLDACAFVITHNIKAHSCVNCGITFHIYCEAAWMRYTNERNQRIYFALMLELIYHVEHERNDIISTQHTVGTRTRTTDKGFFGLVLNIFIRFFSLSPHT